MVCDILVGWIIVVSAENGLYLLDGQKFTPEFFPAVSCLLSVVLKELSEPHIASHSTPRRPLVILW